jgi:hypothetical protein
LGGSIVSSTRKGAAFNWFVGVAVALVIGVAVADSLWPNGGSSSKADQRVGDAGTWSVNKLGGKGVRELFEMNGVRHYLMTPEGKSTLYWRTLGKESAEETAVSGQSCIWKCTT